MGEGALPNLARLAERGCFTRVRPVIPAQTPTNWTTLATGATPGRHGVVQWGSHLPGEPVWEYHRGEAFNAGLCRAEYLWEAAARAGRRSVVMNYAGYPPTTEAACFIDRLFQPSRSYYDLSPATVYHNCAEWPTTDPLTLDPRTGRAELPVVPSTEGTGPTYELRVEGDGVAIHAAGEPLCRLRVGDWSPWLRGQFSTADQGRCEGAVRLKLIELSPDGGRVRLFRTDAFPTDGRVCSEAGLGERLMAQLGPYVHSAQACHLHCLGALDFGTLEEVIDAEAQWWSGAAEIGLRETDASLLVLHWHLLDEMGHRFVPRTDPTGASYDPAGAEEAWETVRGYYRAADRFVGAFIERLDDGETLVAVVSDHGMPANRKAVSLVNAFRDRGWLALTEAGDGVDWTRSKVFFAQNHLWVNLQGRDEGGIVPSEEYETLRSEVLTALRDIRDPETGEHAIAFALRREEAAVVGLWGEYIGDIVLCYAGGYRWSGPEVLALGESRVVFPSGGGNHGPMLPTYETEATSVLGTLLLAGPGVRPQPPAPRLEQLSVCTTDLAPTLAHLLGIDAPAQSEGRLLREFLAGLPAERPARVLTPTDRPLAPRPSTRPRPAGLQGDVTDEA